MHVIGSEIIVTHILMETMDRWTMDKDPHMDRWTMDKDPHTMSSVNRVKQS